MRNSLIIPIAIALTGSHAVASNLVNDPSFELGGVGWDFASSAGSGGCGSIFGPDVGLTNAPHTGLSSAYKNCFMQGTGTISQTVSTTIGHQYVIDFWISSNPFVSGTVTATFAGVTLFSRSNPGEMPYAKQSTSVTATTSSAQFLLSGTLNGGTYFLDDVSITDTTPPVPEISTQVLTLLGLSTLYLTLSRRKSACRK